MIPELSDLENKHWWFRGRREILKNVLRQFLTQPTTRALDVGCGIGSNFPLLQGFAKEVEGLELDKEAVAKTHASNPSLKILQGEFPKVPLPKESYDLITLFDVLEHIANDKEALKEVDKILRPGGLAVITVPALPWLWTEHDELHHHFRRYRKRYLKKLAKIYPNLKIEKLSYFNFFLFLSVALFRLLKSTTGIKTSRTDFFSPPGPLNSLLAKTFALEGKFLRFLNFPIGVSLILVLRKGK